MEILYHSESRWKKLRERKKKSHYETGHNDLPNHLTISSWLTRVHLAADAFGRLLSTQEARVIALTLMSCLVTSFVHH